MRRRSHHLPSLTKRWPHLARIAPLCALRAAGLVLRMQLQQLNESSAAQTENLQQSSQERAESMRVQQDESWRGALAEVHAGVLQQLGFVDLDPGACFDPSSGRNFGRCCSVGDYAAECWSQQMAQEMGFREGETAREEELRCCGSTSRRSTFGPEVVTSVAAQLGSASPKRPPPEVLIPAVEAWLQAPTGRDSNGHTLSGVLVEILAEEIQAEEVLHQQQRQLSRPVEKLTADIDALSRGPLAVSPGSGVAPGTREAWLPVPTLVASGGRRAVYATVAMSPQLLALDEAEAAAAAAEAKEGGAVEEVALDELLPSNEAGLQALEEEEKSPALRALQEAAGLLRVLDQRTEEKEDAGGWTRRDWQAAQQQKRQAAVLEQMA